MQRLANEDIAEIERIAGDWLLRYGYRNPGY